MKEQTNNNPFLHIELNGGGYEISGRGNTWKYLLMFASLVREAKGGRFVNGCFDTVREERAFNGILDAVYENPGAAIIAFSKLGDEDSPDAFDDAIEALKELFEEVEDA